MNKKMKFVSIVAAMAMTATMGASAFAEATSKDPNGNIGGAVPTESGTEVWAGVVVDNPDMRIKVTVPTLFAFVVNGTVDPTDGEKVIKANDGGLLLPNVKVENVQEGISYDLTTTGSGTLTFANYSTYYDKAAGGTGDYSGLEVNLNGSIKSEVGAKWTPVAAAPGSEPTDKYKYQISVNGEAFNTAQDDGGYGMATAIVLDAPSEVENGNNIDATTKLAKTPYEEEATFDVAVGGKRKDYNTVEASAKIGTIVWKVSTTVPTT